MGKLLTRDEFRESVFERDDHTCQLCGAPADDAHHIIERRLWGDGGYYIDNGLSVCEECHMDCETGDVKVETCWILAGAGHLGPLPEGIEYPCDKWGNPIFEDGTMGKGPLFEDDGVQKLYQNRMHLFRNHSKYPRTPYLPWSDSIAKDDRVMDNVTAYFGDQKVVVTEKMDGECTSMYSDYFHARSVDGNSRPWQDWARRKWSEIRYDIPEGFRICGENLYAEHSIHYTDLEDYFLVYGIVVGGRFLDWTSTVEWAHLLGLKTVPVIYRGPFNEKLIKGFKDVTREGYVVRLDASFPANQKSFSRSVAKYVRPNHVQTNEHWTTGEIIQNELA